MSLNNQPGTDNEMQKLLEDAVGMVRAQVKRVEKEVLVPLVVTYNELAASRPILTVFFVSFTLLSVIPITSFLFFCAATVGSFLLFAALAAILAAGAVCTFVGFFLLVTLACTFGTAVVLTGAYIGCALGYRLYYHLATENGRGLSAWVEEVFRFVGMRATEVTVVKMQVVTDGEPKEETIQGPAHVPSDGSDDDDKSTIRGSEGEQDRGAAE